MTRRKAKVPAPALPGAGTAARPVSSTERTAEQQTEFEERYARYLADSVAWMRAQCVAMFGTEPLARADGAIGVEAMNERLLGLFHERMSQLVVGILGDEIDLPPLKEQDLRDLEEKVVEGLEELSREPGLADVPVAEVLLRFHAAVLRAMRRSQRRGGGRRTKSQGRADPILADFERQRRPRQDRKVAKRVLMAHDPSWMTYSEVERARRIEAFLRRARRNRGQK